MTLLMPHGSWPIMRRLAAMVLVFAGTVALILTAWSAAHIFLRDQYDPKFGGPLGNFLLGLQLVALAAPLLALGFFVAVFWWRSRVVAAPARVVYIVTGAGAVLTSAFLASGWFPVIFSWLPGDDLGLLLLDLLGTGLLAGLLTVGGIRWLYQPREIQLEPGN